MNHILQDIINNGGTPYMVGGCVRDKLLGLTPKDVDIEVFQLKPEKLVGILSKHGKVDQVGVSFGVIKLKTDEGTLDFSLPRREIKTGPKHTDFKIVVDPFMSVYEAASRRDFTFNSMAEDINGNIIDPHGGQQDLINKRLVATSKAFLEDVLRPIRGFQFCSRFGLNYVDHVTLSYCRQLSSKYSDLSKERIWGEWEKWAEKGMYPSHGLNFLVASDWVKHYPQIKNIIGVPQNPIHHPEGCVWTHTKLVCDAMSDICARENIIGQERVVFMLAALCHDLGKAFPKDGGTTEFNELKGWTSIKHAEAGIKLTEKFLINISCPNKIKDEVISLVAEHMFVANHKEISDKHICNLAFRLKKSSIKKLLLLIEADMSGRHPRPKGLDEKCILFLNRAINLGVYEKPLRPLVTGDDLLALGYQQDEELGKMFKKIYQHQMNHPEYTKEQLLKDRNGL